MITGMYIDRMQIVKMKKRILHSNGHNHSVKNGRVANVFV